MSPSRATLIANLMLLLFIAVGCSPEPTPDIRPLSTDTPLSETPSPTLGTDTSPTLSDTIDALSLTSSDQAMLQRWRDAVERTAPLDVLDQGKERFYGLWKNEDDFGNQTSYLFLFFGQYGTFANDRGEFRFTYNLFADDLMRLQEDGSGTSKIDPNIKEFINEEGVGNKQFRWVDDTSFELDNKLWTRVEG